jgi:hypothetical protein
MVLPDKDGIECDTDVVLLVRIDGYQCVKGSHSRNAPSDMDYYGYEEIDYTIVKAFLDDGHWDIEVPYKEDKSHDEKIKQAIREEVEEEGAV